MNLDYAHGTKNLVSEEILVKLKERSGNIILFGAGKSGTYFHSLLRKYGIRAACYCDNSPQKQGIDKEGLPVYSYKDAITAYPCATICITSCYSEEIEKQLSGYKDVISVMNTCNWETTDKITESSEIEFIHHHEKELEAIYSTVLKDDKSRAVMQGILNYRLTRINSYIRTIADTNGEYFDDSIIHNKSSINSFVDGGSWTGDTIDTFIKWKKGRYSHIYCFEAEKETSRALKKHIEDRKYENITVFNNAMWNKKEKLSFFNSNGSGGGFCLPVPSSENNFWVDAVAVDDVIKEPVDMIKLDIEGAEINALKGMKNMICQYKPVLAVCVYHKQDDFITLPKLVLDMVPEYSIYFRQYLLTPFSTVMYAVIE